jgi:beta-1,4-mannosyl-glycoprotein beta-1,4-N-acetylglucosaminyltransferase
MLPSKKTYSVYDCFTYDGEECLDLRLRAHWEEVDIFVIVEANMTFSAVPKPFSFDPVLYAWALEKIRYFQIDSQEFVGCQSAWEREKFQRNALQRGYSDANPSDVILIGDVDEIIKPGVITAIGEGDIHVFQHLTFYFYYDYLLLSDPYWEKAIGVRGDVALRHTPEELRNSPSIKQALVPILRKDAGWHFSYLGGHEMIEYKLQRFSHQNLNKPKYKNVSRNLQRIYAGKDIYRRAKHWGRVEIQTFGSDLVDNWLRDRPYLKSPSTIKPAGTLLEVLGKFAASRGMRKQMRKAMLRIWNYF